MDYLSERAELMSRYKGKLIEGGVVNAIVDAFLINARKLIEFLYSPEERYENDIVAEDFFPKKETWGEIRPYMTEDLAEAKRRIGKLLAHLTYNASESPDGKLEWKITRIYADIFETMQVFLSAIDKTDLNPKIDLLLRSNPNVAICVPQYPDNTKERLLLTCVGRKFSKTDIK